MKTPSGRSSRDCRRAPSTRSSRSGFVLTYKTSGVFNFAFGAQAYVSAAMYYQAREEWGWGDPPRAHRLGVPAGAGARAVPRAGDLQPPPHRPRSWPSWWSALGLTIAIPSIYRPARRLRGRRSGTSRPASSPTATACSTTRSACTGSAATSWWPWSSPSLGMVLLALIFRFSSIGLRMRAVVESPRMTELNGIHCRPGVGLQLGAVEPLRRHGRRAHRAVVQHAVGPGLLQPRRGGDRGGGRRAAGEPPARAGRRPRSRDLHLAVRHVPAAVVGRLHVPASPSRTTSPPPSRSSCCSGCSCSCRASVRAARSATRCRGSIRRRRRWRRRRGPRR